ncbi:TerD family protein [Fodinicola feengrottensis]|uniref:TerD family protein n=1 Tax=Fodinicola feengrottensis TaxID=435914 RepID=UPI0013D5F4B1|nr:TerD family protein [Fodinicola feengrottensis]
MAELVAGANMPLPSGPVSIAVTGPYDVSAIVLGSDGRVGGDADFVFYNQPTAPGVQLRTRTVTIDPGRLRSGADRVVLVASPEEIGRTFGQLPRPSVVAADRNGRQLASILLTALRTETAAQLAEIYRRNSQWKLRAIGHGYADGLAGLARDFGVDVIDEPAPARVIQWAAQPLAPTPVPAAAPFPPAPFPPPPPAAPGAGPPPSRTSGPYGEVIALTNAERAKHGLPPLSANKQLAEAAEMHSLDMVMRNFFDHQNPDGAQCWDRAHWSATATARSPRTSPPGSARPSRWWTAG